MNQLLTPCIVQTIIICCTIIIRHLYTLMYQPKHTMIYMQK